MRDVTQICERCGAFLSATSFRPICDRCAMLPTRTSEGRPLDPPAASAAEVPPISSHRLIEQIAQGGMGSVHRARQESLQREVAIKLLYETVGPDDENLSRFSREVRVLAQLDHPNIVPIYDYGTGPDGRRAYSMKLIQGRTLEKLISSVREGREDTTLLRLLRIFRKVCDAIAFAHSRGIIHRDLKPANIMVGEFGEVLVVDWGLALDLHSTEGDCHPLNLTRFPTGARPDESTDAAGLTLYGDVLGTLEYMPPEQALGTVRADARADIYALGGILYTMLTLRPPLNRRTYRESLEDVRHGRIAPFTDRDPVTTERPELWRVPPPLVAVIRKAMAREREQRFASVDELAADVDAYLAGFATSAERITLPGLFWLFVKRHRTVAAASFLLVVVVIGFMLQLIESEQRANANERDAIANARSARSAERLARDNEDSARAALARARILQAESAYAANDVRQMREALDSVPVQLRDAHWQYLNDHADERQAVLSFQGESFLIGSTPHPTKPGVFTTATPVGASRIVDFDAKTGQALRSFPFRPGWVRTIAYSPDRKKIAIGRIMTGGISLHDAETGAELRHWNSSWVGTLEFLPDGGRLLQGSHLGTTLWNADTGEKIWSNPHGSLHRMMPGGEQFVSVSEDHIRIHSMADAAVVRALPVPRLVPQTASLSPDGKVLVVAHETGVIEGIRLEDGSRVFSIHSTEDGDIRRTAFTPDGKRIVTVAALEETGQSINLLDAQSGRLLRRMRGGIGGVESLSIHPLSADLLITCGASATWALPKHRAPGGTFAPTQLGGFIGGNEHVLVLGRDGALRAVRATDGTETWRASRPCVLAVATGITGTVGAAEILDGTRSDRQFLILRANDGTIEELGTFQFATDARVLAVNCDGTRIAASSDWGLIGAFHTATGDPSAALDLNTVTYTHGLAWHGKEPHILIGVFNRYARRGNPTAEEWLLAWDTNTGKRVAEMRKPSSVNCIAAEPGGSRFAEGGDDKFIRIRDAGSLAVIHEFRAHDLPIHSVAWNPAYPILATSSTDRSIRLWDVETGRMIEELDIGLREATTLCFSPDGRSLVAAAPGTPTRMWEIPNPKEVLHPAHSRTDR